MLEMILKCSSHCGCEDEIKKEEMPSIWENLYKLLKKELFSSSTQIQKEKR